MIYSAGQISEILRIPYYTLVYKEKQGKIPQAKRTTSGQRYYTEADLMLIRRILTMRKS